jgi:excisionase family DNA binding protein
MMATMTKTTNEPKPPELGDLPELMTADEIASALRVNRKTVYDAYKRGELPGKRLGRLLRFPRALVVRWAQG